MFRFISVYHAALAGAVRRGEESPEGRLMAHGSGTRGSSTRTLPPPYLLTFAMV